MMSSKLTSTQNNWPPRQQECYAIVAALTKWAHWIAHALVVVLTDHQSLIHLEGWHTDLFNAVDGPTGRRARWHELFSKFNLVIQYIKGVDNHVPDFLSRWAYPAKPAVWDVSRH